MTYKLVSRSETAQIKWKKKMIKYDILGFWPLHFLIFKKSQFSEINISILLFFWRFKRHICKKIGLSEYTAFWTIFSRNFRALIDVCKLKILEMRAWYGKLYHIQIKWDELFLVMLWQSLTKLSAKSSILKLQTSTTAQNFRNTIV